MAVAGQAIAVETREARLGTRVVIKAAPPVEMVPTVGEGTAVAAAPVVGATPEVEREEVCGIPSF